MNTGVILNSHEHGPLTGRVVSRAIVGVLQVENNYDVRSRINNNSAYRSR